MPNRVFTYCRLVALVISAALGLVVSPAGAQPGVTQEQRPGRYVILAAVDEVQCTTLRNTLNGIPKRDLLKASRSGYGGFKLWRDTRFVESQIATSPGHVSTSYWGAAWLPLRLEGATKEQVLFKIASFDRYGYESERLVLALSGDATPSDGEEFRAFLKGRRSYMFTLSSNQEIEDLKQMHGDAWRLWSLLYHPLIYALETPSTTYLLAENAPISRPFPVKLLAFTLKADGERVDHCMLGKVAQCGGTKVLAKLSALERRLLTPASKHCQQ